MSSSKNFADIDKAREISHVLYPDAQDITIIDHGADNIVALVDMRYALQFPRDKNAYARSIHERHILKKLENAETIKIPRILGERTDPPFLITSFVPGRHISPVSTRLLPMKHRQDFAKKVAQFAYTMHTTLTLNEELQLRKNIGLDELENGKPWPVYLKEVVQDGNFPTTEQDDIAKNCYGKWVKLCDVPPTVVVHDDLHTENMMFDDDNALIGILDFGDTNVGTPEQELRQFYRISEEVTMAVVQEYQHLSGHQLDVEAIKIWAIMKELADYSKRLATKNTSHRSFKRACRNLDTWLPKGEWGKGYDLSGSEGFQ